MGTKSRETIYGASIRAAAERATEARKQADRLACDAWNKRMLGFQGPAQPSPALGDAINAGFGYLEVKCLGCNTHQTVATSAATLCARWSRCRVALSVRIKRSSGSMTMMTLAVILRHDHAATFRLHRTLPALEGGTVADRAALGS